MEKTTEEDVNYYRLIFTKNNYETLLRFSPETQGDIAIMLTQLKIKSTGRKAKRYRKMLDLYAALAKQEARLKEEYIVNGQFCDVAGMFGTKRTLPDPDLRQEPAFLAFILEEKDKKIQEMEDKLEEQRLYIGKLEEKIGQG